MNAPRRKSKQRRGGANNGNNNGNNGNGNNNANSGGQNARQNRTAPPAEFWRSAPEPPEPPDISPAEHPTALLQSMGTAPLPGQAAVADHYIAAVIQRAAILATALAASADLLEDSAE
ncbi:hypothetical protein BH10ACT3_BH10ACT3_23640 [soil metagenome]